MFQAICKCIITVSFWLGVGANISSAQPPKELTNSIGMKLVLIPKGSFMMGMVVDDAEQHQVTISQDYYLGVTEVTQEQYERVMGNNPSLFQRDLIKGSSSDHPVDSVSWDDAVEFCKKLSDLPKQVVCIACRQRQNGNTPAARAVRRDTVLGMMKSH